MTSLRRNLEKEMPYSAVRTGELAAACDGHTVDREIFYKFYICGSVYRNFRLKKSNKMQQFADIYLLLNYSTCFGRPSRRPSYF